MFRLRCNVGGKKVSEKECKVEFLIPCKLQMSRGCALDTETLDFHIGIISTRSGKRTERCGTS
jgi:hypothetical protein